MQLSQRELDILESDLGMTLTYATLFELYKLPEPLSDSVAHFERKQAESLAISMAAALERGPVNNESPTIRLVGQEEL